MSANVRVSSSWKTVSAMYTRVGGSWKNVTEGYTKIGGAWKAFFTSVTPLTVNYLVIAGGGGGGSHTGGGGGAGGYRTSAGTSGGGASAESALTLTAGTSYTVTVGGGGAGATTNTVRGSNGSNSIFDSITSTGGGGGGSLNGVDTGASGGSGGGGSRTTGGAGTTNQGYRGGNATGVVGAGGGGASATGQDVSMPAASNGGAGVSSSITGTAVTRAGGGGGAGENGYSSSGVGGSGGGGNGSNTNGATAGTTNTGSGGGGGGYSGGTPYAGGAGGSGVVIIKYPDSYTLNASPGLSHRTVTSGGFNITSFTAGTGTVSFAQATANAYELIETVYLTSSQTSVTFDVSGLGSTYQHLQIRTSLRSNNGAVWEETKLTFNGSSSGYRSHLLGGTGSSVFSGESGASSYLKPWAFAVGANATASVFGAAVIDILDAFETTKNKTVRTLGGRVPANGETRIALSSGLWENTAAVTSITIAPEAGSQWVSGSRFSIYGLKGS